MPAPLSKPPSSQTSMTVAPPSLFWTDCCWSNSLFKPGADSCSCPFKTLYWLLFPLRAKATVLPMTCKSPQSQCLFPLFPVPQLQWLVLLFISSNLLNVGLSPDLLLLFHQASSSSVFWACFKIISTPSGESITQPVIQWDKPALLPKNVSNGSLFINSLPTSLPMIPRPHLWGPHIQKVPYVCTDVFQLCVFSLPGSLPKRYSYD